MNPFGFGFNAGFGNQGTGGIPGMVEYLEWEEHQEWVDMIQEPKMMVFSKRKLYLGQLRV